jgi:hypothetical protein
LSHPISGKAFPGRLLSYPISGEAFPDRLLSYPISGKSFPSELEAFHLRKTEKVCDILLLCKYLGA